MNEQKTWILVQKVIEEYGVTGEQIYKAIKLGWVDWKPEPGLTRISLEDLEENLERIKKLPR